MEKMKVRLSVRTSLSLLVPQTVLSGMGELHLEVIHERLRSDYAINCSLGRLQVAYHETPTIVTTHTGQPSHYHLFHTITTPIVHPVASLDCSLGGQRHTAEVCVRVMPSPSNSRPTVSLAPDIAMATDREEVLEAVTSGVEKACVQGEGREGEGETG